MQTRLISGNRDTLLFSINSLSLEYPSSPFLRESCFRESLHVAWPMRTNPIRALSVLRRWLSVVVPMCLRSSGVIVQCALRFLEHFPLGSFHTVHSILMPPPLFRSFLWNPNISHPRYLLLSDYIVVGG